MTKNHSVGLAYAIAFVLVILIPGATQAAEACHGVKYSAKRAKLQRLLVSFEFPRSEREFLMKGMEQRARNISRSQLNTRGAECGVEAIRALLLSCLNDTLPSTLRSIPSPDRRTGKAMWGKTNVASREAATIGMFHACRGGMMETFLSSQ